MLESSRKIMHYTNDLDYETFLSNEMLRDAVERNIEIIGEASNKLSEDFIQNHPEIEWHKIIGMRNRLIHGYFAVDVPLLWNRVTKIIPGFKARIELLIERMD